MTPIHQNDRRLAAEPSIEPYGCLFRSLGEIAEAHHRQVMPPEMILAMYRWLVAEGAVKDAPGAQAYVMDHAAVINAALYYMDLMQTGEYLWRMDLAGQGRDFGSPHDCNAFIAQARMDGWNISHFYHSDSRGERVWDPYWPGKDVIKVISIRGYRI